MRLWGRRGEGGTPEHATGRARRAGRMAFVGVPVVAVAVIALAATGVMSSLAQFTASIVNSNNQVQTATVGLTEGQDTETCPSPGDGQWHDCPAIDKFGGGTLTSNTPTSQTVTLTNTGTVTARLFLLPSDCSDSLTGAEGQLCGLVTVTVTCTNGGSVPAVTLDDFFTGRNFPTGYAMGTIPAATTIDCTFDLDAGTIPAPGGSISQPISWKLTP